MKKTDRDIVRVKELGKGYSLYHCKNEHGIPFSRILDGKCNIVRSAPTQIEKSLLTVFKNDLKEGLL